MGEGGMGFAYPNDPKSYASSSTATRVSQAGQVKGEGSGKERPQPAAL